MNVGFRPLPGLTADVPRPVLDVTIAGAEELTLGCLIDTGSLHNRFAGWIGQEVGLNLEVEPESLGIGGRPVIARTVTVGLRLGDYAWEAPVSFCDPWPWDFQLLGQEGFLRFFRVTVEAAARFLEVSPSRSSM